MTIAIDDKTTTAGTVTEVTRGGFAERVGILPGDRVIGINGSPVRDALDVMYLTAGECEVTIEIERDGQRLSVAGEYEDDLGLEFESWTFDGIRRCRNHCVFCFIDQLPKEMRRSLYIKDDDYRYSVICGNFVTLTNLDATDWKRIAEQRPGPFRVSVHSTDNTIRRQLLGNPKAPDVLDQLRKLAKLHIPVHCQVVLVPGINDGEQLTKTVDDLSSLYPTVQSIAIVPIGFTKFRSRHSSGMREFTLPECRDIVSRISKWQRQFRQRHGIGLVYTADDFYLRAGRQIPSARRYDGFPQYENGVGLVRALLDDSRYVQKNMTSWAPAGYGRATVVCGTAIAPVLQRMLSMVTELGGPKFDLVPVENDFFGPTVTTSGLLTAKDVVRALGARELGDVVFLPRAMFDNQGKLTLDDQSPADIKNQFGRPIRFAATISEILRGSR